MPHLISVIQNTRFNVLPINYSYFFISFTVKFVYPGVDCNVHLFTRLINTAVGKSAEQTIEPQPPWCLTVQFFRIFASNCTELCKHDFALAARKAVRKLECFVKTSVLKGLKHSSHSASRRCERDMAWLASALKLIGT